MLKPCPFCRIIQGEQEAQIVMEDDLSVAFLDFKPLFPGHVLLIPKVHFETLRDIPADLLNHLSQNTQKLSVAVERAMEAEGSFVAMNNKVSQSVPHFHIHIVPRRKGDGLRGFFWPRTKYASALEAEATKESIRSALQSL